MNRWSIATIASQRETTAAERLEKVGIGSFNPQVLKVAVVRGRHVETPRPLFPGYLFVKAIGKWRELLSTPGVIGVLLNSGSPAIIDSEIVDGIKSRCDRDGFCPDDPFILGDQVRVMAGLLAGYVGTYQGRGRKLMSFVDVHLLGGTSTEVLTADLERSYSS